MRGRRNTTPKNSNDATKCSNLVSQELICYEGESLARLLKSIKREIESARQLDRALPDKIWLKQQFSVGVNDVTRVLERMAPIAVVGNSPQPPLINGRDCESSPVELQAILLASDCNPRWLTKHLPSMASSRKVPLIFVKDKKGGSLRLGELVRLKTAIAIGVKAKGNAINQLVEEIIRGNEIHVGTDCLNSTEMPGAPSVEAQSTITYELKEMPPDPKVQGQKLVGRKHPPSRPLGMIIKVKPQAKKAKLDLEDSEESLDAVKAHNINTTEESLGLKKTPNGDGDESHITTNTGLVSYSDESEEDD